MADFKFTRFKYTWRGDWSAFERYNPDDIISYGSKVYVCLETHNANPNFYNDLNFFNNDIPPLLIPKWELVADGTSWIGEWASDTFYNIGDIVKKGGTLYLCVEGHDSSSKFIEDEELGRIINPSDPEGEVGFINNDGDYWVVLVESQNWFNVWITARLYKVNDIVRYGGNLYKCIISHTSASTEDDGLEASSLSWEEYLVQVDWKGSWATSVRYKINDIVKYGGIVYKCNTGHVSADSSLDGLELDSAYWDSVFDGVEYRSTWAPAVEYLLNDIVKYGSYVFKCTNTHLSVSEFDLANWEIFSPGQEFDNVWTTTTTYQTGDVVRYGGNLYSAIELNQGNNPETSPAAWDVLFRNTRMQGQWSSIVSYLSGDVVRRGGNLYLALQDNQGEDPDIINDDSTTNSEYWDLLIPGIRLRGYWQDNNYYTAGDVVTWASGTYKCVDRHLSDSTNRPDDDPEDGSTLQGRYWKKLTQGNIINRLQRLGDLRIYGPAADGSTVGFTNLSVSNQGTVLTATNGLPAWAYNSASQKVYFVAEFGEDVPTAGTSPQSPWRTVRYACENITGYASIFVKTGTYDEVLPIIIPAYVAVIGDELRSTVIRPAEARITPAYKLALLAVATYLGNICQFIVTEDVLGTEDEGSPSAGTVVYGDIPQVFLSDPATVEEQITVNFLFGQFYTRYETANPLTISGSNSITINADRLKALALIQANRAFIKNEATLFASTSYADSTVQLGTQWGKDLDRILDAIEQDIQYEGNYNTLLTATYFINSSDTAANKRSDMFRMRDGTGLRNLTTIGLAGELGSINIYGTQRPSAGAYACLDPGYGPNDSSAWVGTKSPYVQNVTTFGTACVGLKVDGNLHAGGNQTIVANDFTQVLSDGVGVWCNGTGRSECVSVFTYYNHIGYLCTDGGKIRGTNGNCSYGKYGAVSEGSNISESPITAKINNRYYQASVIKALVKDNGIFKLLYDNAGTNYSYANLSIVGAGEGAELIGNEIRDGGVYEVRIADPGDSTAAGGFGYKFNANASQGGDNLTIQLAGSDIATFEEYYQMRIILTGGDGTGQYGYIAQYDDSGKYVTVGKESKPQVTVDASTSSGNKLTVSSTSHLNIDDPICFTAADEESYFGNIQPLTIYYVKAIESSTEITISASEGGSVYFLINATGTMTLHCVGWEHLVEGYPIEEVLDTSAYYNVEPRVTFSDPGTSITSSAMNTARQWVSIATDGEKYVAIALDSNVVAYSTDGSSWTNTTLPSTSLWTKLKYVGDYFVAFATGGQAVKSADGITWSAMTMPSTAEWRDVTYGDDVWIAVAAGGTKAARTSDLITWEALTLPEGADWTAIEYGKGKFVAVAQSDSSTGTATVYSSNAGNTWTAGSIPSGMFSLTYGNNRFVALSGGYAGATEVSISFDGITWIEGTIEAADWREVKYGQGLFVAVGLNHANVAISQDGLEWEYEDIGSFPWVAVVFANIDKPGKFLLMAGLTEPTTTLKVLTTGRRAQARAVVVAQKISSIHIWEPGSGYTSTPTVVLSDSNITFDVTLAVRYGNGVLANPEIKAAGDAYETNTTSVIVSGDGYRDQYHIGGSIVVSNLTRIPGPGDNLNISSIDDYTYKLTNFTILDGEIGNYTARIGIAKSLDRDESPEHDTQIEIRQQYSQVRLTGHDFLDLGLGNFEQTNYPNTLFPNGTVLAPEDEVRERNGGRVFYTSTDQDGNFRVGELFSVEQSTGTVTLSADFFELQGLEELTLGGVTVGGSGVVIREFSTDPTFTADSNNIIPTQRAIKAFLTARVSGGGADAITGQLTAGVVRVGPDQIGTTTNEELVIDVKVNFRGGIDGDYLMHSMFLSNG